MTSPTTRPGRRQPARSVLAWAFDTLPLAVALAAGVGPVLSLLAMIAGERALGVGIFDPALGADPVLVVHLERLRPGAGVALGGAIAWTLSQAGAIAFVGTTIGARLLAPPGTAASRSAALRGEVPAALVAVTAVATAWTFATAAGARSAALVLAALLVECVAFFPATAWGLRARLRRPDAA